MALLTDNATALSDGVGGLATTLLRYDTPQRIAAPKRLTRLTEAWRQHEPDAPLLTPW